MRLWLIGMCAASLSSAAAAEPTLYEASKPLSWWRLSPGMTLADAEREMIMDRPGSPAVLGRYVVPAPDAPTVRDSIVLSGTQCDDPSDPMAGNCTQVRATFVPMPLVAPQRDPGEFQLWRLEVFLDFVSPVRTETIAARLRDEWGVSVGIELSDLEDSGTDTARFRHGAVDGSVRCRPDFGSRVSQVHECLITVTTHVLR